MKLTIVLPVPHVSKDGEQLDRLMALLNKLQLERRCIPDDLEIRWVRDA